MRIQQNSDAQYNPLQNQDNISKLSGAGKSGQKSGNAFSVPLAGQKGENLIQQRQDLARKQALKVVADAFDGEKKFDAQMQSIKDEINNLQNEINEKNALIGENNVKIKELQDEYGIDPDADKDLSKEEMARFTEYQERVSPLLSQNESMTYDIEKYKSMQMGYVQGYSDMIDPTGNGKIIISETASLEDTQDAVNSEIANILNRMGLLANDVKGSTIDNQI